MRRRNKLLLIIIISSILTYIIFFTNKTNKISIISLGDGISSGETFYNIDGISYNDYIKTYFEDRNLLKNYNTDYSYKNYKIEELIDNINNNDFKEKYLKQIIHNSDVVIISIGEEELTKLSITNDLDINSIKEFVKEYDNLVNSIKEITEAKIIMIGFYENNYLDKTNTIILNSELNNIKNKYNTTFININDLLKNKEFFVDNNAIYFNYKAHAKIADMIIHSL